MTDTTPPALPVELRLQAGGLALLPGDIEKLAPMAAELETSARMLRKDRSYLEEPVHTLRLWSK